MYAPIGFTDTLNSMVALALDAAGDKVAMVGRAHKTGTIDRIDCYVTAITGTPPTYEARLESIASNEPSGSLIAANRNGTFTPVSTGLKSITLTSPYAVTADDPLCAVIEYSSGTVDGSNNATIGYRTTGDMAANGPVGMSNTGSWASSLSAAALSWRYSDGEYVTGVQMITSDDSVTFNSGSTPDEHANLWVPPGGITIAGVLALIRTYGTGGSSPQIILYDSGDSVLGTITIDATKTPSTSARVGHFFFAGGPVELSGGSTYRFAFKPDGNNIQIADVDYANADALIAGNGGLSKSTRVGAGGWADDDTVAYKLWPLATTIPAGGGLSFIGSRRNTLIGR